jgi:hypothetical protein
VRSRIAIVLPRLDVPSAVLFLVPFLPFSDYISLNGTRHRRSEAIEKPTSYRLG